MKIPNAALRPFSGKGSDNNNGVGPAFDHTLFDPTGHYLYITMDEHDVRMLQCGNKSV